MRQEMQDKLLAATKGTQIGAIICCALGLERDATPRFEGKASLTSDGFIMCNFVDADGEGHYGAFVGGWSSYTDNVLRVAAHCALSAEDAVEFYKIMETWCPLKPTELVEITS